MITAPKGCVTDLASIPRPCWILLPPDGPWVKAAIIHDYLYATQGTGQLPPGVPGSKQPKGITRPTPYTRSESDWILRDALRNRGVDVVRRLATPIPPAAMSRLFGFPESDAKE